MFAISPTDINWFKFLKNEGLNTEVNFWTPTPWNISKLSVNDRLYFMLKSPIRKIGGYGQFLRYKNASVDRAWNEFGLKNGCGSKKEFTEQLDKYKSKRSTDEIGILESEIGCIVLTNVVFFDDTSYLDLDKFKIDFSRHIVKIKYFNSEDPLHIHEQINELPSVFELLPTSVEKLKKARLVTERKGQGNFRAKLTFAYNNKCCITGECTSELLEASHIQPYINENSNHVRNGLLMRVDFHKIYDSGLMYIDENYRIHISPQLQSEYYKGYDGRYINLPNNVEFYPSKKALKYKQFEYRNE